MNNSTSTSGFPEYTEIKSIHIGNKLTLAIFEELEHTQDKPFMMILNEDYKGAKITLGVEYFKTFNRLVKAYKNKLSSLGVDRQATQSEREKDNMENSKTKSKFITSDIAVKEGYSVENEEILSKNLVLRVLKLDDTKEKEPNYIVQVLKRANIAGKITYVEIKHIGYNTTDVMHKTVESIKAEFETNYAKRLKEVLKHIEEKGSELYPVEFNIVKEKAIVNEEYKALENALDKINELKKEEKLNMFRTEDYETKATSEGAIIQEEVISDTEVIRIVEAKDKTTALNPYTVEIISRENHCEEYDSAKCACCKTLYEALDVYNRYIKAKVLLEVTEAENCDGYEKIKADVISDIKAIRLSRIDDKVSPEPYIIEIFHKLPNETSYRYKVGNSYETLDEAEKAYTTQLCIKDSKERIITKYREAHIALKSLALEIAEEQTGDSIDLKRASRVMKDAAKYLEQAEWLEKMNNRNLQVYPKK